MLVVDGVEAKVVDEAKEDILALHKKKNNTKNQI